MHYSLKSLLLFCLLTFFAVSVVWADNETQNNDVEYIPPTWFLEYSKGDKDSEHTLVALGLERDVNQNSFGGLYFSQDTLTPDGDIIGVGIMALQLAQEKSIYGARVSLGISKTELLQYERTGIDLGIGAYFPIVGDLSWYLDSGYRLTWLSMDYENSEFMEMNASLGVNYRPHSHVNLFAFYRYDGFVSRELEFETIQEGIQIGVSLSY
ncbi:hypothetical protein [Marinomonas sp. THO17]|uniref:hypothetical protein n=1 Tax=Marinomonas sp. THO17 TaxID=3149048 RepID=UPI00336BCFCD